VVVWESKAPPVITYIKALPSLGRLFYIDALRVKCGVFEK
jgi:hypothetical protein